MKRNKITLIICLALFLGGMVNAQINFNMPTLKEIAPFKDRQPVVVINPESEDIVNKLEKHGDDNALKIYRAMVKMYNDGMKDAVTKFWTYNSLPALYKTRDEIKEMLADKSQRNNYVFIYCYNYEPGKDLKITVDSKGVEFDVRQRTHFGIGGDLNGVYPTYDMPLDVAFPSTMTITYCISRVNYIFNYLYGHHDNYKMKALIAENEHLLSQKTLLIFKDDVDPKFIDNIKSAYPGNYKIIDNITDYVAAISSGDPNSAYIITTGLSSLEHMNWVVNCQDGAVLAYSKFASGAAFTRVTNGFNKDFFSDITEFYQGKAK